MGLQIDSDCCKQAQEIVFSEILKIITHPLLVFNITNVWISQELKSKPPKKKSFKS